MRTSALFVATTNIEFFLTWTGGKREGLSQCLHFFGQREFNFL